MHTLNLIYHCFIYYSKKGIQQLLGSFQMYLICVILLSPTMLFGQSDLSKDSVEQILKSTPAFSIYKDNYFITGIPLDRMPNGDNSDAKIQFSFNKGFRISP